MTTRLEGPQSSLLEPLAGGHATTARRARPRLARKLLSVPEVRVAAVLAVIVFAISLVIAQLPVFAEAQQHLGAEYYNIGLAIADGRGFSDPFGEHTGPTAWMPPVYPTLIAGLHLLFGTRSLVAAAVIFLMNLSLITVGSTIYAIARRSRQRLPAFAAVLLFLVWVLSFFYWFFVVTTDVWILMLVVNFMALAVFDHLRRGRVRPWAWGVLGALAALTSPTLGMCAALTFGVFFWRSRRVQPRKWLMALAVALALVAPWTLRNAVVFHQFIPVKSNANFELYQANVMDDDGVYDAANMTKHPYNMLESRHRYAQYGETKYIEAHRRIFVRQLRANPEAFLRRIVKRATALVVYHPLAPGQEGPLGLALRRVVYVLPVLAFAAAIWVRGPHRPLLLALGLVAAIYLAPYVVIAFYVRYFIVLTPLLVLIAFLGADALARRWSERRGRTIAITSRA